MKKFAILITAALLAVCGSFTSFADCAWDTDNYGIKATWDQLSSGGELYLYKGTSYKVGNKISTSRSRTVYDFSERIKNMGPGTYHFTITDSAGRTWTSEDLQVDEDMYDSIGILSWSMENGKWRLRDYSGSLMKGWQLMNDKWYYLDTVTGECYIDTITPDGYRVNADGAWDGNPALTEY